MSIIETKEFVGYLLGNKTIAYRADFARIGGGVTSGVFLSQLFYWSGRGSDPDGWIWKTQSEWTQETTLTRNEQETARRKLRERGILKEKRRGIPARLHYFINLDRVIELLNILYQQTSLRDSSKQEGGIPANRNEGNPQSNSETPTEITSNPIGSDDPIKAQRPKSDGKKKTSLSEGQRAFLDFFSAKRFANKAQREAVQKLESTYGTPTFLEAARWAAELGLSRGKAIQSMRTALKNWDKGDKSGKGSKSSQAARNPGRGYGPPAPHAGVVDWLETQGIEAQ